MLFSSLLQDKCSMVHLNALETFAHVAEQNTHESILAEILNSSSEFCEVVAMYLSQVKKSHLVRVICSLNSYQNLVNLPSRTYF